LAVSSLSNSTARHVRHDEFDWLDTPVSTSSTASTRRTCQVVSTRDVTCQVKFGFTSDASEIVSDRQETDNSCTYRTKSIRISAGTLFAFVSDATLDGVHLTLKASIESIVERTVCDADKHQHHYDDHHYSTRHTHRHWPPARCQPSRCAEPPTPRLRCAFRASVLQVTDIKEQVSADADLNTLKPTAKLGALQRQPILLECVCITTNQPDTKSSPILLNSMQ